MNERFRNEKMKGKFWMYRKKERKFVKSKNKRWMTKKRNEKSQIERYKRKKERKKERKKQTNKQTKTRYNKVLIPKEISDR